MDEQRETYQILFKDIVPLPFRILILIQLGIFLWYLLVIYCYDLFKINILHALNLSYSAHKYTLLDHQLPATGEYETFMPADLNENVLLLNGIWDNFKSISIVNSITFVVFKLIQIGGGVTNETSGSILLSSIYYLIPAYSFAYNFYKVFYKWDNRQGQVRIFTTLKRILLGRMNSSTMRTNDILLSDSLTSYSKVLNDFGLFLWNYYYNSTIPYNNMLEFVILCIPIIIRMKQCWYEYSTTKKFQHFLNMVKYSTGLGPLLLNLLIKKELNLIKSDGNEKVEQNEVLANLNNLNNWWYLSSLLNSTYSFIWDVKMDWNFKFFDNLFKRSKSTIILRPRHQLIYNKPIVYYAIIMIDFILRFIWVLKLFIIKELDSSSSYLTKFSTFLFGYDAYSFGYTIIELLEIFRRWLWCFLKLESDWVNLQTINEDESLEMNSLQKRG